MALMWLRRDARSLVIMLALALLSIAPVLPDPRGTVPGWYGDNVQYVYAVGWMAQAPLLGRSPFTDPRPNYPDDLDLMATDVPYVSNLVVAPVSWALGPVFSYNLIIFLSLLLSGYFTYLWALRVTGSRVAALASGVIFLLSPYRMAHAFGHLQLVATYGLPLFFWALDDALTRDDRRWRQALGLFGSTFLVGSASQYYLVICLVIGAGYALMLTLPDLRALASRGWVVALAVLLGALLSAAPYLAVTAGTFKAYNISDTRLWSADPLSFLIPPQGHPLWGWVVKGLRSDKLWIEKTLYVGLVPLALAGFACVAARGPLRRRVLAGAGAAALAAIFALGTDLHFVNEPLSADTPFWLPAYYLGQLPFIQLMRIWSRFGVITGLFVALLAGAGLSLIAARLRGRSRLPALALLCALIVIDLAPMSFEVVSVGPRPVDRWLAAQPIDAVVAHLPPGSDTTNYGALLGSLFHGHHLAAYMHPTHTTPAYNRFADVARRFPAPGVAATLRAQGYTYLVFERQAYTGPAGPGWPAVEAALAADGAAIAAELDGVVVVRLR